MTTHPDQLGFEALLQDADAQNAADAFARETAHLPDKWEDALAFHKQQIVDHHAAMLKNDFEEAMHVRKEAHLLARKLNNGNLGILASEDAPGCKLDVQPAASEEDVPLWGQSGVFIVEVAGVQARIEMEGMFGIGATAMPYLGFSVRAVDLNKPFISETGYGSFLGYSVPHKRGMTTEGFVHCVVETYVAQELRGKLVRVNPR